MRRLSAVAVAAAIAFLGCVGGIGPRSSLAAFVDSESAGSTFTASSSFGAAVDYYLHNNPTPPVGDTNAQANLSMTGGAPTAAVLHNYDANLDAGTGRVILRGGSGAGEATLGRYQNWRTGTLLLGTTINGTVTVELWTAMRGFTTGTAGEIKVFLRDYDPLLGLYGEIASATVARAVWQTEATWIRTTVTMSVSNYLVLVGRQIEVKVTVGAGSSDDMWLAYDTIAYSAGVDLP